MLFDWDTEGKGAAEAETHEPGHGGGLIGCLTYQSTAATKPTESELADLVAAARTRNHALGVTGMLLYDKGRFLQTLEGPLDGLETIWSSIRRDERHCDIELLTRHVVEARLFSNWDLLLYRQSEQVPITLRERFARKPALAHHVPALVRLALDADEARINDLVASLTEKGWSGADLVQGLLEPAARALGDAWLADECCEFEMTLGLGMLQVAGHAARRIACPDTLRQTRHRILIATMPGEKHMLGPSLLADSLTDAGWSVDMAFPQSVAALARMLREQRPDAVDIALSDALQRPGSIEKLRETVERARAAMGDDPLVISVGGRLFAEAVATAEHVSADHARRSAAGADMTLAELVRHRRTVAGRD